MSGSKAPPLHEGRESTFRKKADIGSSNALSLLFWEITQLSGLIILRHGGPDGTYSCVLLKRHFPELPANLIATLTNLKGYYFSWHI
jgi:hypothetical protein